MRAYLVLATTALLAASMAQAVEVYRWKDDNGKVHYSDVPPPPNAKDAALKKLGGNAVEVDKESFSMRDAAKKKPVTLYANNCGAICDSARQLLAKRGVPFTSKNPESSPAEAQALTKLIGSLQVPVLVIGKDSPLKGFDAGSWEAALDAAGYPTEPVIKAPAAKSASSASSAQPEASEKTEDKPAAPKY